MDRLNEFKHHIERPHPHRNPPSSPPPPQLLILIQRKKLTWVEINPLPKRLLDRFCGCFSCQWFELDASKVVHLLRTTKSLSISKKLTLFSYFHCLYKFFLFLANDELHFIVIPDQTQKLHLF